MLVLEFLINGGIASIGGDLNEPEKNYVNTRLKQFSSKLSNIGRSLQVPASLLKIRQSTYLFVGKDVFSYHIIFAESPVGQENRIKFDLNKVKNELKNEYIKIYSIKLLLKLMDSEKETLNKNVVLPLQKRLQDAFSKITGTRYTNLTLTEDFNIKNLKVKSLEGEVNTAINTISYGTKEQLAFLFRFAAAQFLSKKEAQIMILDDSFVNTDYHRLEEIIRMINKFSDKIQFLIFTWNSKNYEKFNKIFQANFINLEDKMPIL